MNLFVTIREKPAFYSLYADGPYVYKIFEKDLNETRLFYNSNAILVLYYTYPTHREACVIRNTETGSFLPGLSKGVTVLFSVHASRVDKLRRAIGFLRTHTSDAFSFDDGFYTRLYFILLSRGKLDYTSLSKLAVQSHSQGAKNVNTY